MNDQMRYGRIDPVSAGLRNACPRCGEGRLLHVLSVRERCAACGLDYEFADSGDGPAVFIILLLGFVVLGMALYLELNFQPPVWVHIIVWPPVVTAIAIPAMRIMKAMLIAQQYRTDAAPGRLQSAERQEKTEGANH